MKHTFKLTLIAVAIVITALSSCTKPENGNSKNPPDDKKDTTTQTVGVPEGYEAMSPFPTIYYADSLIDGKFIYRISLSTDSAYNSKNEIVDAGNYYSFIIVVPESAATNRTAPPKGTYKLSTEGEPMTILNQPDQYQIPYSYMYSFDKEGYTIGTMPFGFKEAELIIEDNRILFKGTADDDKGGTEYKICCIKEVPVIYYKEEAFYGKEQETKQTKTETFDEAVFSKKGTDKKLGTTTVSAFFNPKGEKLPFAFIQMFAPIDATDKLPAGQYIINSTKMPNTILASEGYEYGVFFTALAYEDTAFFIVSGSADVTDNSFTLVGKSFYGSDITIKYNGDMTFK